ncbi:MAG: phosphoribosylglycinamide formyltransferase [Phycisphaerae bacterium]|nr:phosphoribosylglycinamide formyltransferase [Phycisphaerae bacterium]
MAGAQRHLRLGVLLSGGGRTLLNLLDEIDAGRLDAEVAVVIASRACAGAERARARGLDVRVVAYRSFVADGGADVDGYSAAIVAPLDEANVDLVLEAGLLSFWRIPSRYLGRVMNIHPALLPSFGGQGMHGRHVHEAVLAAGCKVSGCTVHFANNEYDAGPIIAQRCVPVREDDDADALAARVFEQECIAYPEAVRLFAAGRLRIEDGRVRVLDT